MTSVSPASIAAGSSTHLKWNTFVTPSIPVVAPDVAPGEAARPWPPISSTLVYGVRDAVLVDLLHHGGAGKSSGGLDRFHGKKSHNHLCDSRARRSLLWGKRYPRTLPERSLRRRAGRHSSHEATNRTGGCGGILGTEVPESAPEPSCSCPRT